VRALICDDVGSIEALRVEDRPAGAIGALKRMVDRQVSGKIVVLPEL